ncbi:hypothetical protein ACWF9B_25905 [Streptomyces sp. NPDC055089]
MGNPKRSALSRMVANLGRGNAFVIVERVDAEVAGDWYVQVWLRDDNTYQLEFRDGTAAEHYQTRTISGARGLEGGSVAMMMTGAPVIKAEGGLRAWHRRK